MTDHTVLEAAKLLREMEQEAENRVKEVIISTVAPFDVELLEYYYVQDFSTSMIAVKHNMVVRIGDNTHKFIIGYDERDKDYNKMIESFASALAAEISNQILKRPDNPFRAKKSY